MLPREASGTVGQWSRHPHTLHPTPYTLHHTPYTYTLHPTPYTLHPFLNPYSKQGFWVRVFRLEDAAHSRRERLVDVAWWREVRPFRNVQRFRGGLVFKGP